MDGSPDFRPEPAHRASDPSFEEMLRRARDARLGNAIDNDGPLPTAYVPPADWRDSRLWGWLLFAAGVLAGVLLSVCVVNVTTTVSSWRAEIAPPAAVTALPAAPTSTPTPFPTVTPTATPFPTVTLTAPPTTVEIISLVQDFYDTQEPDGSSYLLLDVTGLQIQSQDELGLTACVSYGAASVNAPDTVAFSDTRLFTLAADSDGSWQVVQMDGSDSCSLS